MFARKRGISDVVSTVLIILLVVAAVAIIGGIILNAVNKSGTSVSSSFDCQSISIEPIRCSYNNTHNFGLIDVSYPNGTKISNATLVFDYSDGTAVTPTVSGSALSNLNRYSFLIASTNTAIHPVKLSVVTYLLDKSAKVVSCPISKKIDCSLPAASGANTPANSPVSNGSSSFTGSGSNPVSNNTSSGSAPIAPSNLRITSQTNDGTNYIVSLAWNDNSNDETRFDLYVAFSDGTLVDGYIGSYPNANAVAVTLSNLAMQAPDNGGSAEYIFKIRAHNAYGDSAYSNTVSVP